MTELGKVEVGKEKEAIIQKFKEDIISLVVEGIEPKEVSNHIWKYNTDQYFPKVYEYIKKLAEAVD